MEEKDIQKFIQLIGDGGNLKKTYEEHFHSRYEWSEVLKIIKKYNLMSVQGAKKNITENLNKIALSATPQQEDVLTETKELVDYIYLRYKETKDKLDKLNQEG